MAGKYLAFASLAVTLTSAWCGVARADEWTDLQRRGTMQEGRKTGAEVEAERATEREVSAWRLATRPGLFGTVGLLASTKGNQQRGDVVQLGFLLVSGLTTRTEFQTRIGVTLDAASDGDSWLSPGAVLEGTFRGRPISTTSIWLLGIGASTVAQLGTTLTRQYADSKIDAAFIVSAVPESVWKLGDREVWEISLRVPVGASVNPRASDSKGVYFQPSISLGRLF